MYLVPVMTLVATLAATPLSAQQDTVAAPLPVRIHDGIRTFRGDPRIVVAAEGEAEVTLYSAHKEGGRPWADAIFIRRTPDGTRYLSRAYDCASGTYRWLGEAERIDRISLSVSSVEQVAPRRLVAGTLEHELAAYVCAL